jgi:hypothetical protein
MMDKLIDVLAAVFAIWTAIGNIKSISLSGVTLGKKLRNCFLLPLLCGVIAVGATYQASGLYGKRVGIEAMVFGLALAVVTWLVGVRRESVSRVKLMCEDEQVRILVSNWRKSLYHYNREEPILLKAGKYPLAVAQRAMVRLRRDGYTVEAMLVRPDALDDSAPSEWMFQFSWYPHPHPNYMESGPGRLGEGADWLLEAEEELTHIESDYIEAQACTASNT